MAEQKFDRKNQPRCANVVDGRPCNHSKSFHGKDGGRCKALGCKCDRLKVSKAA